MTNTINSIISISILSLILIFIISFIKSKKIILFISEISILIIGTLLLHFLSGFPKSSISFGQDNQLLNAILLWSCVLLGMASNYFFNLNKKFDLISFLKPFFISPIIILPLIGAIGNENMEGMQLISLLILSFQNGFFWKEIYNRIQKQQ